MNFGSGQKQGKSTASRAEGTSLFQTSSPRRHSNNVTNVKMLCFSQPCISVLCLTQDFHLGVQSYGATDGVRRGRVTAEPTRRGGVIVREPHTANAITALCGTQTPQRPTRDSAKKGGTDTLTTL